MSFRVWKGEPASTPRTAASPAPRASLPWELVEAAAGRLAVLALLCAAAVVLFAIADWRSFARAGAVPNITLWLGAIVASLALSLSIAWMAWRGMLAPAKLLDVIRWASSSRSRPATRGLPRGFSSRCFSRRSSPPASR